MTIQDLGALGELLGSVAVLVTLVYLAFQTRQNTMAIAAQLDAARLGAAQELNLVVATSTELLETLNGDRVEQPTTEQGRLHHFWTARFYETQWNFNQLRQGLGVPLGAEARMAPRIRHYFNNFRSVKGWWEANQWGFDPEFVEWVEETRSKTA